MKGQELEPQLASTPEGEQEATSSPRNYASFFYTYFAANIFTIFVAVYLPVYYFEIINVNRLDLAFVQVFAYSALFLKPVLSIYYDTHESKSKRLATLGAIGVVGGFTCMILVLPLLLLFGLVLAVGYLSLSLMDVAIDKFLVTSLEKERRLNKNIVFTQVGSISGTIAISAIFLLTVSDMYSLDAWNLFSTVLIVALLPLLFIIPRMRERPREVSSREAAADGDDPLKLKEVNKRKIGLLCVFAFFAYADKLYDYPLEPWILKRFGEYSFTLFVQLQMVMVFINLGGILVAGYFSDRVNKKRTILVTSLCLGALVIVLPLVDLFVFLLIFAAFSVIGPFMLINLIHLMVAYSQKKVIYYQLISSCIILARVIFVPLGTFLSVFLPTETIIVLAGILLLLAVVPILFL